MTIGTITVGGRADSAADGFFVEDLTIKRTATARESTCEFSAIPKGDWVPAALDQITILQQGSGRIFGGYVTSVERIREGSAGKTYALRCEDWSMRLAAATAPDDLEYENRSDKYIVQDLVTRLSSELGSITAPDAVVGTVQLVVSEFDARGKTLLQCLNELAETTGAEWYVDPAAQLRWFNPVYRIAPIVLSDRLGDVARPNLLSASESVDDDAAWYKGRFTVTADVPQRPALVPLGTADRLYETTSNGAHYIRQALEIPEDGTYTFSCYVLSASNIGGRSACELGIRNTSGSWMAAKYDLANEASDAAAGTVTHGIRDASDHTVAANPWRLVWVTAALDAGDAQVEFRGLDSYTASDNRYAGDTTKGYIVTGLQLRSGTMQGEYRRSSDGSEEAEPFQVRTWASQHETPTNKVTFRGAVSDAGVELKVVESSAESIAKIGTWHRVVVDRNIKDATTARLRAKVELSKHAEPRVFAQITTEADGLDAGMTVLIDNSFRDWHYKPLVIRSIRQEQIDHSRTRYTCDLGPPIRDLDRLLQLLAWRSRPDIIPQLGLAGSIHTEQLEPDARSGDTNIEDGTITGDKLVQDTITNREIKAGTVRHTEIEANTITFNEIAPETITKTQIADDAITTPKILAGAITGNKIHAGAINANLIFGGAVNIGGKRVQAVSDTPVDDGISWQDKILFADTSIVSDSATWGAWQEWGIGHELEDRSRDASIQVTTPAQPGAVYNETTPRTFLWYRNIKSTANVGFRWLSSGPTLSFWNNGALTDATTIPDAEKWTADPETLTEADGPKLIEGTAPGLPTNPGAWMIVIRRATHLYLYRYISDGTVQRAIKSLDTAVEDAPNRATTLEAAMQVPASLGKYVLERTSTQGGGLAWAEAPFELSVEVAWPGRNVDVMPVSSLTLPRGDNYWLLTPYPERWSPTFVSGGGRFGNALQRLQYRLSGQSWSSSRYLARGRPEASVPIVWLNVENAQNDTVVEFRMEPWSNYQSRTFGGASNYRQLLPIRAYAIINNGGSNG